MARTRTQGIDHTQGKMFCWQKRGYRTGKDHAQGIDRAVAKKMSLVADRLAVLLTVYVTTGKVPV